MANYQPLPHGWKLEFDPNSQHPYWVDTLANPPRSIWVHPYEDEQYLYEHPEVRERLGHAQQYPYTPPPNPPPPPPYIQPPLVPSQVPSTQDTYGSRSMPYPIVSTPNKKGFFGKLKDMTTGNTEAEKKIWKDSEAGRRLQAQMNDRRQQLQMAQQEVYVEQQIARAGHRPNIYITPGEDEYSYRGRRGYRE